jgi:hypothetical protein
MEGVFKNEREKSERSFGTGPGAVLPKRAGGPQPTIGGGVRVMRI